MHKLKHAKIAYSSKYGISSALTQLDIMIINEKHELFAYKGSKAVKRVLEHNEPLGFVERKSIKETI